MSRYINYDAIDYRNDRLHDKSEEFLNGVIYMAQRIEDAPSIEVVRCKDCVFGELDNRAEMYRCRSVSFPHWNKGEHFCSYGERETDHE